MAGIFLPKTGFHDINDAKPDLWGTPFRIGKTKQILILRLAGIDKKHYTSDDLVVEY